jgi:hypothetical protein
MLKYREPALGPVVFPPYGEMCRLFLLIVCTCCQLCSLRACCVVLNIKNFINVSTHHILS